MLQFSNAEFSSKEIEIDWKTWISNIRKSFNRFPIIADIWWTIINIGLNEKLNCQIKLFLKKEMFFLKENEAKNLNTFQKKLY